MRVEIKAGLITIGIILFCIGCASLIIFVPEVFATLIMGVIVSVMVYHLYHSVLHDLRRCDETVDPKRDRM